MIGPRRCLQSNLSEFVLIMATRLWFCDDNMLFLTEATYGFIVYVSSLRTLSLLRSGLWSGQINDEQMLHFYKYIHILHKRKQSNNRTQHSESNQNTHTVMSLDGFRNHCRYDASSLVMLSTSTSCITMRTWWKKLALQAPDNIATLAVC